LAFKLTELTEAATCPQMGHEIIKQSNVVDDLSHRAMRFTNFGPWTIKRLKAIVFHLWHLGGPPSFSG